MRAASFTRPHPRRADRCALTRTKPPRPSPNRSLGPSSLTVRPPLPRSPPPPPPLPTADAAGRFFLPCRRAAASRTAACGAERGPGAPATGRAAGGRTVVAAGRVARSPAARLRPQPGQAARGRLEGRVGSARRDARQTASALAPEAVAKVCSEFKDIFRELWELRRQTGRLIEADEVLEGTNRTPLLDMP